MSDSVREAIETLGRIQEYVNVPFELMTQFVDDIDIVKAALGANGGEAVPFAHCYTDVNGKAKELCHPPECASEGDKRVITALYTHPAPPSVVATDIQHSAAIRASIKMLRERFEGKRCDSDGVSGCIHCNIMFLCAQIEKLLTRSED